MNITTRQLELIEAACKLLTRSGVTGLTIKNLAKEMNFSESAIYRHFASKEEIVIAMLQYLAGNTEERLANLPYYDQPEDNFKEMFREQFRFFKNNTHFIVTVFSDGLMEESRLINMEIKKLMATKIKYLMKIIQDGQQKKVFCTSIATEDLAYIVMGAFKLQMFKWRLSNFDYDISEVGEKMISSLLTIIKNR